MVLRVRRQSRDFPDYQLAIEDAEGDLHFAYPPEKGQKNLVQKLQIGGVRRRQYRARKAWLAVTFDERGINGEFGASAYGGYLNGGFSFFFSDDSPWIGWVAGTGVDTRSLTSIISPQNFTLTGPLDFEIQLDAFRKEIDRLRGVFRLTEPGRMKIGKIDDVLANLPPQWVAIKRSSTRIALETLRDFDYTAATGDFWFVQSQGILNLDLSGPNGSRKFEVALHDDQGDLKSMAARKTPGQTLSVAACAAVLLALASACQTPSINLATSQPINGRYRDAARCLPA